MSEPAGIETTDQVGPAVAYQGHIGIEWPAPAPGGTSLVLPGWGCTVWDALSGLPITTVTRIELHADALNVISADVTMYADENGQPVYSHRKDEPWPREGTWPFLVAEMRVRPAEPERGPLDPRFIEPCASLSPPGRNPGGLKLGTA